MLSDCLGEVYERIARDAKKQIQHGKNESSNKGSSFTQGISSSANESMSSGENISQSTSSTTGKHSDQDQGGINYGDTFGVTKGVNESIALQNGNTSGESLSFTYDENSKERQEWLKFFDNILYPRFDCAMGKGLFISSQLIFSTEKNALTKLGNVMKSIFSGESGNRTPLSMKAISKDDPVLHSLLNFQQPLIDLGGRTSEERREQCHAATVHSKIFNLDLESGRPKAFYSGCWMSATELALIAGIPRKEVVGLKLRAAVEFGLNVRDDNVPDKEKLPLGKLMISGNETDIPVNLDLREFDRHLFVAGVTGSGKTTTCQSILCGSKRNFLVIEPAKTEYRILLNQAGMENILVFSLGNNKGAPFRLNPLEFSRGESISSRVDMIMASFTAAFDMEAAIPQLLEQAVYKAYEKFGWNTRNDTNQYFGDSAYDDGVYAFPTIADVLKLLPGLIRTQGFDERLYDEYLGSIRARLGSFTFGAKGAIFNCRRSTNFDDLLERKVILELEEIRSGSEKSLAIGFILTSLMTAIKKRYQANNGKKVNHITLIEEAHRLMSRYVPGDNPNKKNAVELFADMLAEIRKYGEAMIIADQIPDNLTPAVLKNTNIKIVHRLFAQDDKDAIGATMALSKDQREYLSNLEKGGAIVFSGEWNKAIHVKVAMATDTSAEDCPTDDKLYKNAFAYYAEHYRNGVFPGLERFSEKPDVPKLEKYIQLFQNQDFSELFSEEEMANKGMPGGELWEKYRLALNKQAEVFGEDIRAAAIAVNYLHNPEVKFDDLLEVVKRWIKVKLGELEGKNNDKGFRFLKVLK